MKNIPPKSKDLIKYFCNEEYEEEEFIAVLEQYTDDPGTALEMLQQEGYIKHDENKDTFHIIKKK